MVNETSHVRDCLCLLCVSVVKVISLVMEGSLSFSSDVVQDGLDGWQCHSCLCKLAQRFKELAQVLCDTLSTSLDIRSLFLQPVSQRLAAVGWGNGWASFALIPIRSPHHGSELSVACWGQLAFISVLSFWSSSVRSLGPDDGRPWLLCQLSEFSEPLRWPCSNYGQSTQDTDLGTLQRPWSCLLRCLWLCRPSLSCWSPTLPAHSQKTLMLWAEWSSGKNCVSRQFDSSCQSGVR